MKYLFLALLLTGCATIDVTPQPLVPRNPLTKEERCKVQCQLECTEEENEIGRDACIKDKYEECMRNK